MPDTTHASTNLLTLRLQVLPIEVVVNPTQVITSLRVESINPIIRVT